MSSKLKDDKFRSKGRNRKKKSHPGQAHALARKKGLNTDALRENAFGKKFEDDEDYD